MNETNAITTFCIIDDAVKAHHHKRLRAPCQEVMTDSEVVFVGILSTQLFAGNLSQALAYARKERYCPRTLSKSRFIRRLHRIPARLLAIIQVELARCSGAYETNEYIIDSFPCPICHNVRINRCRIAQGREYRGYNANKRQYFYGLKVHAIASSSGVPICCEFTPGSVHDLTAFKGMNMDAVEDGVLYADAAYTDYSLEEQLENAGLRMVVARKRNSKRPMPPNVAKEFSRKRKRIETCFSGIMRLFPRTLHVVKLRGLVLKLTLFVAGFTALCLKT